LPPARTKDKPYPPPTQWVQLFRVPGSQKADHRTQLPTRSRYTTSLYRLRVPRLPFRWSPLPLRIPLQILAHMQHPMTLLATPAPDAKNPLLRQIALLQLSRQMFSNARCPIQAPVLSAVRSSSVISVEQPGSVFGTLSMEST
jgi:hypothetical protein